MFDRHANLKYKYGNVLWAEGYYVSTVGLNESDTRNIFGEQENADIVQIN